MIYKFKKGSKIHIKESQKGSFTKYCNGKVTNECIQKGKNSSNPKTRKKAVFAQNARKWSHKQGGVMKNQLGGSILENIFQYFPKQEVVGDSDIRISPIDALRSVGSQQNQITDYQKKIQENQKLKQQKQNAIISGVGNLVSGILPSLFKSKETEKSKNG